MARSPGSSRFAPAIVVSVLACSQPATSPPTMPEQTTSGTASARAPVSSAPASASSTPLMDSTVASVAATASVAPVVSASEPVAPQPSARRPTVAPGQCRDRSTLQTAKGEVSCYPFRCRAGRCLQRCASREDCAGSDGPGDLAQNGWPLGCATSEGTCYPLSPRHVTGHHP